jgi:hypothetical protein
MSFIGLKKRVLLVPLFILTLMQGQALAILGEGEDSIERDRAALSGQRGVPAPRTGYRIETVTAPRMTLEEYVDENGKIFAVTWKGKGLPDFSKILGSYFSEYQEGMNKRRSETRFLRRPLAIQGDHLILQSWGRRGLLSGRAYLPALFPAGVTEKEIR